MKNLITAVVLILAGFGCSSNPADSVPNACLAAKLLAADEQTRGRAEAPEQNPTYVLEFCRVVPDQERNKALALVTITSQTEAGLVEAAVVGRMGFGADGWALIASDAIYDGLVLKPAPPKPSADAGTVQNQQD